MFHGIIAFCAFVGIKWADAEMCNQTDEEYGVIRDICRKSCGVCTPDRLKPHVEDAGDKPQEEGGDAEEREDHGQLPPVLVGEHQHEESSVDPELLHKRFMEGAVKDHFDAKAACELNGKPNGQILARIDIADPPGKEIKIFCGIYTMEKNHETNVKATRETWAKKCDGFVAFSTIEDPMIPSVKVEHEGPEAYDNMWQKSRSIWKYIYTHYKDQFDFFVMGGDDMFYIVENLRSYLASEEIENLAKNSKGELLMMSSWILF